MSDRATIEAPEYAAFTRRIMRALARLAAEGDVEALPEIQAVITEAEEALAAAVRQLHDVQGYSWAEIAARLGMTKQAAHQRFAR